MKPSDLIAGLLLLLLIPAAGVSTWLLIYKGVTERDWLALGCGAALLLGGIGIALRLTGK